MFPRESIAGALVSRTMILKLALLELPDLSVAVTVTNVDPSGKLLPDGTSATTAGEGSTLSVAERLNVTITPDADAASATTSWSSPMTGGATARPTSVATVWLVRLEWPYT